METEATAGQRLVMRSQDGGRYSSIRSADVSSIQKTPQLNSGVVSTGGPSELANSPQPPPLSPHPCERGEDPAEGLKNPSTPNNQHFYQPPLEPCLGRAKGGNEEPVGPEGLTQHFSSHHPQSSASGYSDPPEPTVYTGTGVQLEDDSTHSPWRLFNLSRKKEAELPTPQLPGERFREDGLTSQENLVSVTE